MTIYRGNALWHREAGKSRPITDSPQANIGAYVGGSLQWSGRLAEFRIWDKARTAEEIGADWSRRLTGKGAGPGRLLASQPDRCERDDAGPGRQLSR